MQVSVSRVSPVEVEVKVSLPKERVSTALSRAYNQLGKNAQLPGFRKGKVPLPLLKQYFRDRVVAQVSGELIDETLFKALQEQKLEPVVQPRVEPSPELSENAEWTYTAKLEVRPEVPEVKLEGIELKRQVATFDDADVDHQIEHLRDNHSTLRVPDPPRPARKGDLVTFDYDMVLAGTPREDLNARNRSVEVGTGRLLKELDEALIGMAVGDKKDVTMKFPADHVREELRDKDAVIKVSVSEIREKVLPELDDEFAKDVGSESLAALKAKVRADMEKQAKEQSDAQLREDAVTALVEKNAIAVPPSLVENAVAQIAREIAQQLRIRSAPIDPETILKDARGQAEQRVRAGLLLAELARANNLTVTEDDLNARIEAMAQETGKAAARLRAEHRDARKREALANAVLEDKVLDLLLSKVKVTDVPAPKHEHNH